MARVIVIGAGIGGLAAAARLTALGHDAAVCEQAQSVGGKLGWHSAGGFSFDTGPSLLTLPHVFRELFAATGEPLDDVLTLERVEPAIRYRFGDGTTFESSSDPARLRENLAGALGETAAREWFRLLRRAERIWLATAGPILEAPGPPSLLRLAVRTPHRLPVVAPTTTLAQLGRRYLSDPRLRLVLARYATYTGSDPRRAPAALASIAYAEHAFGAWYVRGGLHRLADALAARAERIRLGCRVLAITTSGGRVDGVCVDAGDGRVTQLPADVVVANADATAVYSHLLPRPRLLPRGEPSLGGFVLLLGLRGGTPGLAQHTVFFPDSPAGPAGFQAAYDAEFDAVFAGRPAEQPTVYVSRPPDLAPPGHEAWFVLVNAPRQGPFDWTAPGVADRYAQHILDLLAARGCNVRSRLVYQAIRTPADLARDTGTPGGAIYGTSSNGTRAAFRRPANRSPVPGLFLVGGSAHPGGGLPLVALSARSVAQLVGRA